MKHIEKISYETSQEREDAYALLRRLIEPDDDIAVTFKNKDLIIIASERDIKALKLHLAHMNL